eukprot:SAG31_NODE_15414_length_756_cov_1.684932_2_plen_85_part_01
MCRYMVLALRFHSALRHSKKNSCVRIQVFPNVKLITLTISSALIPSLAFSVVFLTIFVGFAMAFTMYFGTGVADFRTFSDTLTAL